MEKCAVCGSETSMYICNVPICVKCDGINDETRKLRVAALKAETAAATLAATA
jgi:hypothetical protein